MGRGSLVEPDNVDLTDILDPDEISQIFTASGDIQQNPSPDEQRPNESNGTPPTVLITDPGETYPLPVGRYLAECLSGAVTKEYREYVASYVWPMPLQELRTRTILALYFSQNYSPSWSAVRLSSSTVCSGLIHTSDRLPCRIR
jgi:hypothetical protein